MGPFAEHGLLIFVVLACCWYCSCMYYFLRSFLAVVCYSLLPVLGIGIAAVIFASIGIQHAFPPLFLTAPLIGSSIGVYVAYRIDQKFS